MANEEAMRTSRQLSRWLVAFACYFLVLSAASWGWNWWVDHHQTHMDVPLGGGRHVHVHWGARYKQRYFTTWSESSEPRRVFAPLRVDAVYRAHRGAFGSTLFDLALPTWPLPAAALLCGGVAGGRLALARMVQRRATMHAGWSSRRHDDAPEEPSWHMRR
jgi:hypothetical protein